MSDRRAGLAGLLCLICGRETDVRTYRVIMPAGFAVPVFEATVCRECSNWLESQGAPVESTLRRIAVAQGNYQPHQPGERIFSRPERKEPEE